MLGKSEPADFYPRTIGLTGFRNAMANSKTDGISCVVNPRTRSA